MRKRVYEKKLAARLVARKSFLVGRLQKEWDAMERTKRREEFRDMTKRTGIVIGKTLLVLAALGGVAIVAAVAPNIFAAFGRIGGRRRFFTGRALRRQLQYLEQRGYARVKEDSEDEIAEVRLTEFGNRRVIAHAFGELKIAPPARWDGRWRMVTFDIPNRHKWAREGLREKLKLMGFFSLQKSVFIFPYPCEEEIVFLADIYDIRQYVRYVETDLLSPEDDFLVHFELKRIK